MGASLTNWFAFLHIFENSLYTGVDVGLIRFRSTPLTTFNSPKYYGEPREPNEVNNGANRLKSKIRFFGELNALNVVGVIDHFRRRQISTVH